MKARKNFYTAFIVTVTAAAVLTGCTKPTPDCNNPEVVDLVTQLVEDRYASQPTSIVTGAVIAELSNIGTTRIDKKTEIKECSATLRLTGRISGQNPLHTQINYKITPSDKDNGFSITIDEY